MRIGLSYDLKKSVAVEQTAPDDALEEYDSSETVELIASSLEALGHSVVMLGGGVEFLDNIRCQKVDFVFNIAEGRGTYRSREAQVPSILEMLNIPYSGSDPLCLAVCLDKSVTKTLVRAAGVQTPKWRVINDAEELNKVSWKGFLFPAIIKPAYEGSSKGIRLNSVVDSSEQAVDTVSKLLECYHQPVMLEEFITGDEVTVGAVGNTPTRIVGIMRVLLKTKQSRFVYSIEVKRDYKKLVEYECPAQLEEKILEKITASSLKAFRVLGCCDFARIDFRVSPEGVPYFLEINPLPGLGNHSDLVIMAKSIGWTHQQLVGSVLEAALKRQTRFICA